MLIILYSFTYLEQFPHCLRAALILSVRPHCFGFNPKNSLCFSRSLKKWTADCLKFAEQLGRETIGDGEELDALSHYLLRNTRFLQSFDSAFRGFLLFCFRLDQGFSLVGFLSVFLYSFLSSSFLL